MTLADPFGRGTPNSTTTSMSELSTVAIKDGHRGHPHHHSHRQPLSATEGADAERADRISRLAGLERVATVRQSSSANTPSGNAPSQTSGYFEPPSASANTHKERSTVGSASATGSIGGRTTWASGSDAFDNTTDKMSEDQDVETSSTSGFSDEGNASLVGFGEAASSTVSGPVSSLPGNRTPQRQSLQPPRSAGLPPPSRDSGSVVMTGVTPTITPRQDARMIDGMTYDSGVVDTASAGPRSTAGGGSAEAERIVSDHMDISSDAGIGGSGVRRDGRKELGKFPFEEGN